MRHNNFSATSPFLTDVSSKNYSLAQIINMFIAFTQHFLKTNILYKNPSLPKERVENILGVINV